MTARPTNKHATGDEAAAAAAREAKGSVQEAIGKLIGDDEARRRGAAEKQAGADDAADADAASRP